MENIEITNGLKFIHLEDKDCIYTISKVNTKDNSCLIEWKGGTGYLSGSICYNLNTVNEFFNDKTWKII